MAGALCTQSHPCLNGLDGLNGLDDHTGYGGHSGLDGLAGSMATALARSSETEAAMESLIRTAVRRRRGPRRGLRTWSGCR